MNKFRLISTMAVVVLGVAALLVPEASAQLRWRRGWKNDCCYTSYRPIYNDCCNSSYVSTSHYQPCCNTYRPSYVYRPNYNCGSCSTCYSGCSTCSSGYAYQPIFTNYVASYAPMTTFATTDCGCAGFTSPTYASFPVNQAGISTYSSTAAPANVQPIPANENPK